MKPKCENTKVTAPEVPVQEQQIMNINGLRIQNGLKPIPNSDFDFIPKE